LALTRRQRDQDCGETDCRGGALDRWPATLAEG
jgi:hypothetical protein